MPRTLSMQTTKALQLIDKGATSSGLEMLNRVQTSSRDTSSSLSTCCFQAKGDTDA